MRISPVATLVAAVVGLAVVGLIGFWLLQPARPLLTDVSLSLSRITPNADRSEDVTLIRYTINRTATVSIAFTNKATGQRFMFRDGATRIPDVYEVPFSGVVDGYILPGENIEGTLERRLIPDGEYTWTITAAADGQQAEQSGDLVVAEGDTALPLMNNFSISPQVFTPNQDGYDDRVSINVYLAKAANLNVYLEGAKGERFAIAERFEGRMPGEEGAHVFDYDGGVDNNTPPPPDGTYRVIAVAEDLVGQRITRIGEITLKDGGLPNAEIVAQPTGRTVTWDTLPWDPAYYTDATTPGRTVEPPSGVQSQVVTISLPLGDLLLFRLTVHNYGTTPIRTIGPWPGTVYDYKQTKDALVPPDSREAPVGAWRVGIECERSETSLPYRWAVGAHDQLTKVQRDKETLYYLMPGQSTVVWGAIRMTEIIRTENPQACYAALIHERVEIPPLQRRVGEISVELTTSSSATGAD